MRFTHMPLRALGALTVAGALIAVPAALAAAAPTVTTGVASSVSATAATVAGSVNPAGQSTTYAFQYGTTTNYGSQSSTAAAGSGTSDVSVHATLTGLRSATIYHYRLVATSAAGSTAGADGTFTTAAVAPTVALGSPSLVTSGSATLVGTVNPHGVATTYSFQYGPTTSYGLQTTASSAGAGTSATTVRAGVDGLRPGTTYHYRLVAQSAQSSGSSSDGTFTTTGNPAPGGTLPVVSQTAAVDISSDGVQLNGAVNPEGPTTQWYFQYGLSAYYGLQTSPRTLSGTGARPVNVQLSGLQSATTYHYRLVAVSANGVYDGPDGTFTTKTVARAYARGFVVRVSSTRSGGSRVRLTVSGYVVMPGSVEASQGCTGAVAVQTSRGGALLALHRAFLGTHCRFRLSERVSGRSARRGTTLTIRARFEGNQSLEPANAYRHVRV